jgi:hypothetical protein
VQGIAKMRLYAPDGAMHEQAKISFALTLNGCNWLIRLNRQYEGTNGIHAPDYEEVSCDGTNVYFIDNFRTETEKANKTRKLRGSNVATGISYKGQVFHNRLIDEAGIIWLTYASGCYLLNNTNGLIEPAMVFDGFGSRYGPPQHEKLRADWTLSATEPLVPMRVVYYGSANRSQERGGGNVGRQLYPAMTNAVYEALSFTNFQGFALPLASSLTLFTRSRPTGDSEDLRVFVVYTVNLVIAERIPHPGSFVPVLPGATALWDARTGYPLQYLAATGWPTVPTLETDPIFMKLRKLNPRVPAPVHSPWPVRTLLALLALAPLWLWALRRGLRNRKRVPG